MDRKQAVVITTHFAVHHDAIGNDIQVQAEVLRAAGYEVAIYSDLQDHYFSTRTISWERTLEILADPRSILIFHHSCYMETMDGLLKAARGSIILKYHNITPAAYFPHNPEAQRELSLARLQSEKIVQSGRITMFLGDSSYNNQELIDLGAPREKTQTLAPFHFVEDFKEAGTRPKLVKHLKDGRFNVLFVGRLMKHKGQLKMIEVIDHYIAMYGRDIRLCLVGRLENPFYGEELAAAINDRRLSSFIEIHQDVDFQALHTFYQYCDAFLMLSEHEGFGVPILEAQFHGLPIITIDRAAVKETMGPDQLVFQNDEPAVIAAALHRVRTDLELKTLLISKGKANYASYTKDALAKRFLAYIRQVDPNP